MRGCTAYSTFLMDTRSDEADIYLLDAKQLCKKLGLDFFMSQIELLYSKYDVNIFYKL